MQNPTIFYLIRPAETEAQSSPNMELTGKSDKEDLSPEGRDQARLLADELKNEGIRLIFTSNLARSKETAKVISDVWEGNCQIIVNTEIGEGTVESILDAANRLVNVLREIAANHRGETVVVISHGHSLRSLLVSLNFVPDFTTLPAGSVTNTGYIKLSIDENNELKLLSTKGVNKAL